MESQKFVVPLSVSGPCKWMMFLLTGMVVAQHLPAP